MDKRKENNMERMTITRGLAELKLLDSRIEKATNNGFFVVPLQKNKKIFGRLTIEEFSNIAKETLQSVNDLINRRSKIKEAIVISNASTYVTIGSESMTVAEAIERKTSISYEKDLLAVLERQLKKAEVEVANGNQAAEAKALEALNTTLGSKNASKTDASEEDAKNIFDPIYNRFSWIIVDPAGVATKVIELRKKIEDFELNVDFELSSCNATTFISIE
ncbi:MAG: hypothetical protein GX638_00895 [Crenarchaeota archaeon]|nr:hypothetical protein [Thermoproteota archaeon]